MVIANAPASMADHFLEGGGDGAASGRAEFPPPPRDSFVRTEMRSPGLRHCATLTQPPSQVRTEYVVEPLRHQRTSRLRTPSMKMRAGMVRSPPVTDVSGAGGEREKSLYARSVSEVTCRLKGRSDSFISATGTGTSKQ